MQTAKSEPNTIEETFGQTFFKRNPFCCRQFLAAFVVFLGLLVYSFWFFKVFWARLSLGSIVLLIIILAKAPTSILAVFVRHNAQKQTYFSPESSPSGNTDARNTHIALSGTARAILDDAFYTCGTLFLVMFLVSRLLRQNC
jgi:hypothetical protein